MIEIKNRWTGKVIFTVQANSLEGAYLEGAHLEYADLRNEHLEGAHMKGAYLKDAYMEGAHMEGTDLEGAYLKGAHMEGTDLEGAYLKGAYMRNTHLKGACLKDTYLKDADLIGTDLIDTKISKLRYAKWSIVPEKGAFTAWKKIKEHLIELEVPKKAKRLNAIGSRKCRVSVAKVISVTNLETKERVKSIKGGWNPNFEYKVGRLVKPDSFDDNLTKECAHGIHCFITREEAIQY